MIILDTSVLSELMRPRPDPAVQRWIEERMPFVLFTTAVTKAEILYGIELLPPGKRRDNLLAAVDRMFNVLLSQRVLGFDSDSAKQFAIIAAERRSMGRPISDLDAQIAAIARINESILATRNVSDFENCGIELVDPWQG